MIGFLHNGQVCYAFNIEDFREHVDEEVFEGLKELFEQQKADKQKYERLEQYYDSACNALESAKTALEEMKNLECFCETLRDDKDRLQFIMYDTDREIKNLINHIYDDKLSPQAIILKLEEIQRGYQKQLEPIDNIQEQDDYQKE